MSKFLTNYVAIIINKTKQQDIPVDFPSRLQNSLFLPGHCSQLLKGSSVVVNKMLRKHLDMPSGNTFSSGFCKIVLNMIVSIIFSKLF